MIAAGDLLGDRWRVSKVFDEGGQGRVFLVTDEKNAVPGSCVLKQAKPSNKPDRLRWRERFAREIEQTKRFDHPNVLRVYDDCLEGDEPYIVTEYCSGGTLRFEPTAESLALLRRFLQICEGVKYAHDQNVIHRDLKPENIFLRASGEAVVGDFGICYVEDGERFTILDEVVGPAFFASPELRDGRTDAISFAADIYSLGKILHFLFKGKRFDRENFRDEPYNLARRDDGYFLEHINNLLDTMITATPATRLDRMSAVISGVKQTIRLIEGRYNPLTREQGCRYCGLGTYEPVRRDAFQYFGLRTDAASVHALQCQHCGNVQIFQIHNGIKNPGWLAARRLTSE